MSTSTTRDQWLVLEQVRFGPLQQPTDTQDIQRHDHTFPSMPRRKMSDGNPPQFGELYNSHVPRPAQAGAREPTAQTPMNGNKPNDLAALVREIQQPQTPVIDSELRKSIEENHSQHRAILGLAEDPSSAIRSKFPTTASGTRGLSTAIRLRAGSED